MSKRNNQLRYVTPEQNNQHVTIEGGFGCIAWIVLIVILFSIWGLETRFNMLNDKIDQNHKAEMEAIINGY